MIREWDITQWVDLRPGGENDQPAEGLAYMSYAAMGPNIPKDQEKGQGWIFERARPDDTYRPLPNVGDPGYLDSLGEAEFPSLGKHRIFVRFDSDTTDRQAQLTPPRNAAIMDWLKANCSDRVEVVWAATMMSSPFGGVALIAMHNEAEFLLAKLRFKEFPINRGA